MPKKRAIKKHITLNDLALMVAHGFDDTTAKFYDVTTKLDKTALREDLEQLKREVSGIKSEVSGIKSEVSGIKSEMVTKSYLDDKLADLEGSVIVRQRKEDHKVNLLIEFLKKRKILGKTEVKMLQEFQVFPASYRKS